MTDEDAPYFIKYSLVWDHATQHHAVNMIDSLNAARKWLRKASKNAIMKDVLIEGKSGRVYSMKDGNAP